MKKDGNKNLPFVSVIVLNYNGKKYLKECFSSLRKVNYPRNKYEVIMVDNASTDGSVEYVKKHFPWVKIIKLDKNYGFAEGNNIGFRKSKGEYVVFLNNDTKVDKNWLIELVKVAKSDEKIAVCGSKVMFYDEPERIQYAGGMMNILGKIYSKNSDRPIEVFWAGGCSMLVKRKIVEKHLKYVFDPRFFMYFEEIDFSWRIRLLGYKVMFVPSSVVYHKGGGISLSSRIVSLTLRNRFWSFKKNLSNPLRFFIVSVLFFKTFASILNFKLKGIDVSFSLLKHIFDDIENDIDINRIPTRKQIEVFKI